MDDVKDALDECEARLTAIEISFGRVGDGTYGKCAECGDSLVDEMLADHPTARWCPRCTPASAGG